MRRTYLVEIQVEVREETHLPTPSGMASCVSDALSKEWWDYQDDEDFKVVNIGWASS